MLNFHRIAAGQPRKPKYFKVQYGYATSGAIGVEWKAGYNGGYDLIRFELQYRIESDNDLMDYDGNIKNLENDTYSALIHPLKPNITYNVYVRAINKRPPSEGKNFSPWTPLNQTTTGE